VLGIGIGLSDKTELESVATKSDYVISYPTYGYLMGADAELGRHIAGCKLTTLTFMS